jgi:predicted NAD/FAD-binding protein
LLRNRPVWRTVVGGSQEYVKRLTAPFVDRIRLSTPVTRIHRLADGVEIANTNGEFERFDDVVIATHADQALEMLTDATQAERRILGAFGYTKNRAVLHTDSSFMPRRRTAWSSWNYVADTRIETGQPSITYWMNKLQPLGEIPDTFVTLNPTREPEKGKIITEETYHHPVFDAGTEQMRQELWALQGLRNTWFCGAYFGSGFHEDGIQAGLAVAEDLGGLSRPWKVTDDSGRIVRLNLASRKRTIKLVEAIP